MTIDYAEVAARVIEGYEPVDVQQDLTDIIVDAIRNRPRSQQTAIGPSEIGHECGRWLAYKLADTPILNDFAKTRDQWRTQVGTAVHTWLAEVFGAEGDVAAPMFLVEHSLHVGTLTAIGDGEPADIYGSGDLYYQGVAVDWKVVGPTTLKKCRTVSRQTGKPHGPSIRYRKQINTYGKGWRALGLPVNHVMIAFLPAAGDLKDAYWWSDPYNEVMADEAMERLNGTNLLVHSGVALERILAMLPTADAFCTACPYYQPHAERLVDGCPGGPKTIARVDPLFALAPANDD